MMVKETIIVSLCAFGVPCRYHALTHKMGQELYKKRKTEELRKKYHILPLCGEIMGGLPTPRPPCKVVEEDGMIKVIGRNNNIDYTIPYQKGANEILKLARKFGVKKAYLLKGSPMCGQGYGVLARLLVENGIRVCNL